MKTKRKKLFRAILILVVAVIAASLWTYSKQRAVLEHYRAQEFCAPIHDFGLSDAEVQRVLRHLELEFPDWDHDSGLADANAFFLVNWAGATRDEFPYSEGPVLYSFFRWGLSEDERVRLFVARADFREFPCGESAESSRAMLLSTSPDSRDELIEAVVDCGMESYAGLRRVFGMDWPVRRPTATETGGDS